MSAESDDLFLQELIIEMCKPISAEDIEELETVYAGMLPSPLWRPRSDARQP